MLKWQTSNAMCAGKGCQLAGFRLKAVNPLLAWIKYGKPLLKSIKCREIIHMCPESFQIWDMDEKSQVFYLKSALASS